MTKINSSLGPFFPQKFPHLHYLTDKDKKSLYLNSLTQVKLKQSDKNQNLHLKLNQIKTCAWKLTRQRDTQIAPLTIFGPKSLHYPLFN